MNIYADKYGTPNNFAVAMKEAINDLNDGDTLVLENKEYNIHRDFCQSKIIHMTNTDSFKNPTKYFGVLLENKNNITIDGNGATLLFHGDMCALAILGCNNVKLKNFSIRYQCPSNAEMKVAEKKGKKVKFIMPETQTWYTDGKDITFFEQSPFTKKNYWEFKNDENSYNGVLHSGKEVYRTRHSWGPFKGVKSIERLSENEVEITYKSKKKFKVGDVYTFSQNKNRHTCGVLVNESSNISAENINVHYLPGFGWLSQMSENISFDNVNFSAYGDRVVSAFADLIHVCGCKGKVSITNCHFEHAHDDAINIHGSFIRFKEKIDKHTAVFEFIHHQQGGHIAFKPGDKAQLYYRSNLQEDGGLLTVKKCEDDIENKTAKVTFEEKLPDDIECKYMKQPNIVVENKTYCPDVEISDCTFEAIPTRGVLCTSSGKVRIHNNKFSNCSMAHIFISNDAYLWYESGPVRDVEIYSNTFVMQDVPKMNQRECSGVLIKPYMLGVARKPVHKNISIYGNYFNVCRDRAVTAYLVDGLNICGNYCDGSSSIKTRKCRKVYIQK